MTIYQPYTYVIHHPQTNQSYYGVRYANSKKTIANPSDLWNTYFTSSLRVKKLIESYGKDSFLFEIRKVFNDKESAIRWETKVLRRLNVLHNDRWINANVAGGLLMTEEIKNRISISQMGHKRNKGYRPSEETRAKMRAARLGKPSPNKGKTGKVSPNKGKTASLEIRQRMSEGHRRNNYTGRKLAIRDDGSRYWVYPS